MNLPKIDPTSLPDLDDQTGVFGARHSQTPMVGEDDFIFILMCYLAEIL